VPFAHALCAVKADTFIFHLQNYTDVQKESLVASAFMYGVSAWMVKAYCHKLIKLSPVLQTYAQEKEVVSNIHGIRTEFLQVAKPTNQGGIYFLGKLLWAKGLDVMLQLETDYRRRTGDYFPVDIIGSGPDEGDIEAAFLAKRHKQRMIPARFVGRQDHLAYCADYKIFVNPSLSEVLCTCTAEAVAMGKFVIIPAHPSNTFFEIFPNCLMYRNKKEFCQLLQYAMTHAPEPLFDDLRHILTWEAATERCLEAAAISRRDAARLDRLGKIKAQRDLAKLHNDMNTGRKGNVIRAVFGAGPVANQHIDVNAGVAPSTPTKRATQYIDVVEVATVAATTVAC
jgi:digalactosyldiacylglycerol synthase